MNFALVFSLSIIHAQSSETRQCSVTVVSQLVNEAEIRFVRGEYAESYRLERGALACHEAKLQPADPPARPAILSRLGQLSRLQGHLSEAETWLKQAVETSERDLGAPDTVGYVSALVGLATVRSERRRHVDAEPLVRRAIEVCGRLPETVKCQQSALNTLGALHAGMEDAEGAERVYRRALALDHGAEPDAITATLLHNLATVQFDLGWTADAERHYRDALTLQRRLFPQGHPDIDGTIDALQLLLRRSGRKQEARQLRSGGIGQ
jgi:tetratricopeptide (TPR) repeat protein